MYLHSKFELFVIGLVIHGVPTGFPIDIEGHLHQAALLGQGTVAVVPAEVDERKSVHAISAYLLSMKQIVASICENISDIKTYRILRYLKTIISFTVFQTLRQNTFYQ